MSADLSVNPPATKIARKKFSFIVHDPDTFKAIGRFVSTTPSLAAKKAASRGFDTVHLRKAGTKIVYIYTCEKVKLDEPKVVKRGDTTITFSTVSKVKLDKKYEYTGRVDKDDEVLIENPKPDEPVQ